MFTQHTEKSVGTKTHNNNETWGFLYFMNHQSIPKTYVYLIGDLVCLVVLLGKEHSYNFWCLKCKLYPNQYIKNNMLVVSVGLLKYCS